MPFKANLEFDKVEDFQEIIQQNEKQSKPKIAELCLVCGSRNIVVNDTNATWIDKAQREHPYFEVDCNDCNAVNIIGKHVKR